MVFLVACILLAPSVALLQLGGASIHIESIVQTQKQKPRGFESTAWLELSDRGWLFV
jgi:hypothetical protein